MLAARKEGGSPGTCVAKNVGPRRLRWCRVSATELGVGQVHSEGGGAGNILDMFKW